MGPNDLFGWYELLCRKSSWSDRDLRTGRLLSSAEPERERIEFIEEAQRRCRCELTPAEASRYWLGQGLSFIVESPADYIHLILRKAYLFFNGVESQNNLSFYFAQDFSPILSWAFIGWWFICPLGIAGWFISSRSGNFLH